MFNNFQPRFLVASFNTISFVMKKMRKDTLLAIAVIVLIIGLLIGVLACFTDVFGEWADYFVTGAAMLQLSCLGICSLDSCLPQW